MASHSKLPFEPADLDHVLGAHSARAALGVLLVLLAAGALLAWQLAA